MADKPRQHPQSAASALLCPATQGSALLFPSASEPLQGRDWHLLVDVCLVMDKKGANGSATGLQVMPVGASFGSYPVFLGHALNAVSSGSVPAPPRPYIQRSIDLPPSQAASFLGSIPGRPSFSLHWLFPSQASPPSHAGHVIGHRPRAPRDRSCIPFPRTSPSPRIPYGLSSQHQAWDLPSDQSVLPEEAYSSPRGPRPQASRTPGSKL